MKTSIIIASLIFLAACTSNPSFTANADKTNIQNTQIGTMDWFELVETQFPTSDGQGHGPDYGSQEWCEVVYFKIYGEHSEQAVSCDEQWFEFVDHKLTKQ